MKINVKMEIMNEETSKAFRNALLTIDPKRVIANPIVGQDFFVIEFKKNGAEYRFECRSGQYFITERKQLEDLNELHNVIFG